MNDEPTWQLPADVQIITLFIAAGIVVAIVIGFRTLWQDWRKQWDIEDYVEGCIAENVEVLEIEAEHPTPMPRRPKCLSRLGWHN